MQDSRQEATNVVDPQKQAANPWPVRALTVLLSGQALALAALGLFYYFLSDLPLYLVTIKFPLIMNDPFVNIALIWCMSLLAVIATLAFIALWRNGWVLALLLQGIILVVAFALYIAGDKVFSYVMMLIGIFMIIYLHNPDVEKAFHTDEPLATDEEMYE